MQDDQQPNQLGQDIEAFCEDVGLLRAILENYFNKKIVG
jgi:hypothetical protein